MRLPEDTKRFKRVDGLKWGQLKVGTKLVKLDGQALRWKSHGEIVGHRTTQEGVGGQLVHLVLWRTRENGIIEQPYKAMIWQHDDFVFIRPSGTCPRCNGDGFVSSPRQEIKKCKACAGHG